MTREEWLRERTFAGSDFDPVELATLKADAGVSVSVVLPTLNVASTIGPICAAIRTRWIEQIPLVDELVAIDSRSGDATARVAAGAGARVVQDRETLAEAGPGAGKGEAMWKSLAATGGDLLVWIDADIEDFDPAFVPGLLGPLLSDEAVGYVKALYRRPLGDVDGDGGRVTEICARPLLNRFFPELAGFVQPLSGEAAGRRALLESVPFFSGYAVEIGLLIDIMRRFGLGAMAQVDLGRRRHRNQPTPALGPMAYAVTQAVLRRAGVGHDDHPGYARPAPGPDGYLLEETTVSVVERPPMASVR